MKALSSKRLSVLWLEGYMYHPFIIYIYYYHNDREKCVFDLLLFNLSLSSTSWRYNRVGHAWPLRTYGTLSSGCVHG